MEIFISQHKDPYKPISIMKCHQGFERCSDHVSVQNDACFPCNPGAASNIPMLANDPLSLKLSYKIHIFKVGKLLECPWYLINGLKPLYMWVVSPVNRLNKPTYQLVTNFHRNPSRGP